MVVNDEAASELESALNKARKLKQRRQVLAPDEIVAANIQPTVQEKDEEETNEVNMGPDGGGINITLNATSEFCRSLGEIPTYGMAGNREEDEDELMVSSTYCLRGCVINEIGSI